jgi:hypothetical protein
MNILQLENKLAELDIFPTAREICSVIDMNEQSYSRKKKAETDIKQADIRKLEQYYNISFSQQSVDKKVANILPCCASCGNGLTIDTSLIYNYDENAQYIYAVASGSSMEPVICSGDVVLAKKFDGNFTDGIYLFNIGDDFFIKTLAKNVNQIECISANPQYDKIVLRGQELDKLVILGSVVGIVRHF